MNSLEQLMAEFDNHLTFIFDDEMPQGLHGLIVDDTIYINNSLPFERVLTTLAEEIGHYKTGVPTDIIDLSNSQNKKEEIKARKWSYKKILPYRKLEKFIKNKHSVESYEIAEEFQIPEDVVKEVVGMYKTEGYIEEN